MSYRLKRSIIRTAPAFVLLAAGFMMAWPIASEMSAAGRCVDSGGSYDYNVGHCDFKANHASVGLWQGHGAAILGSIGLGVAGCFLLFRRRP